MESLTEVFCLIDDFCMGFEPGWNQHLLQSGHKKRSRPSCLCLSELMTLAVLFHQLRYRQFKSFYLTYARAHLGWAFPGLPSYQRCLELMPRIIVPMTVLFDRLKGACTGISIIDSSPLAVCDNLRIKRHRVFSQFGTLGKSSTGWFFGFKLHSAINHRGELLAIKLTAGNVDDRKAAQTLCSHLFGRVYADKGYIAQWLAEDFERHDAKLITKVRKNMKPVELSAFDRAVLQHRSVIETVFDELKNLCQIEHTRHRSINGFLINLVSAIIAYCLIPNKPRVPMDCFMPAP